MCVLQDAQGFYIVAFYENVVTFVQQAAIFGVKLQGVSRFQ
jgi:hypothetical protein